MSSIKSKLFTLDIDKSFVKRALVVLLRENGLIFLNKVPFESKEGRWGIWALQGALSSGNSSEEVMFLLADLSEGVGIPFGGRCCEALNVGSDVCSRSAPCVFILCLHCHFDRDLLVSTSVGKPIRACPGLVEDVEQSTLCTAEMLCNKSTLALI